MLPFLSVIVAIYNSEKYLQRCIDSILRQTYRDFELILVDDGSADQSLEICRKYAKTDKRIRIERKTNGGCVSARKQGAKAARGEYITFVDSDDWIEDDWFEKLCSTVQVHNADILIAGFKIDDGEKTIEIRNEIEDGVIEGKENLNRFKEQMLFSGEFFEFGVYPSTVNKLYRTSLLKEIISTVNERITMGEDAALSYPCIEKAEIIEIVNCFKGYHYCIDQSNIQTMTKIYEVGYFDQIQLVYRQLKQRIVGIDIQNQLKYYKLYLLIMGIEKIYESNNLPDEEKVLLAKQALRRPEYEEIFEIKHLKFSKNCRKFYQVESIFVVKNKPLLLFVLWKIYKRVKGYIDL